MVATGRIAAAAQMDPTYSSCGVNAHPHLIHVYGSLGQRKPAPKGHLELFRPFRRSGAAPWRVSLSIRLLASLIPGHDVETSRQPQNRKYTTYRNGQSRTYVGCV